MMNHLPDASQVHDFQRALAQCEVRAAFYGQAFGGTHPDSPAAASDVFVATGESPQARDALGLAAAAIPRSRSVVDSSALDAAVGSRVDCNNWLAATRLNRTYSQQAYSQQPHQQQQPQQQYPGPTMSRSSSSRSDHSMAPGPLFNIPRSTPGSCRLPSVQEHGGLTPDVGMDPDVYLASAWVDDDISYLASTGTNMSAHDMYGSFHDASACPSMISAPSVSEPSQPLTRQNSSLDAARAGGNMMRLLSSQSCQGEELELAGDKATERDQDFFGVGAGFATTPASMERSVSSASARSTASSLERRCKEAMQRVRHNSSRNVIAPKPHEAGSRASAATTTATAATAMTTTLTTTTTPGKLALQKTPYQRPKHPKVYCDQCSDHPDGFRGDHELRRHLNAKHKGIVKKFICRDPATVGQHSNLKALYPLQDCRACASKKQYGAYYNAAAHLRRTHFRPKAPRGKNKGAAEEKRGGKGGDYWPPMAELKLWYVEIYVAGDGSTPRDDGPDDGSGSSGGSGGDDEYAPESDGGAAAAAAAAAMMDDAMFGLCLPGGPLPGGGASSSTSSSAATSSPPPSLALAMGADASPQPGMGFLPRYGANGFFHTAPASSPDYGVPALASHSPFGVAASPHAPLGPVPFLDHGVAPVPDYLWVVKI